MNSFESFIKQPITYLASVKSKLLLIGFLMIFIIVFLVVYAPFDLDDWDKGLFFRYVLTGGGMLLISQFVLRPLLTLQHFKNYSLLLWCLFEVLLITFGLYLIFSPSFPTLSEKIGEYYFTLTYVALLVPGPYLLFVWYFGLRYKVSSFTTAEINTNLEDENELITLTSENDKVILAVRYGQILYVKSSGNYLDIYYLEGETVTKETIRIPIKELESKMKDSSIVRIHRSYMVNKHKISSFKKTRKGYSIVVQYAPEETLIVSLGYKHQFEEALNLNATH